jgi:protein O-mannose beta-1,4-N-acetylglucosaminyltransferase
MDLKGRLSEVAIESIIDEVMGRGPTRPELIVPPDVVQSKTRVGKIEEVERPPTLEADAAMESDPLDVPLVRQASSQAAERLAQVLVDAGKEPRMQAAPLEPIANLEKILGLGESSMKRLNDQIEELGKRLSSQTSLIDELYKNLGDKKATVQSTMGDEMMKQLEGNEKRRHSGFSRPVTLNNPPLSTIVCTGSTSNDRVCKIRNLCFDPTHDRFFIFKDTSTLEAHVPKNRTHLVDTTSIDGHNKFFFDFSEVHPEAFRQKTVELVEKTTFMISRFHALNIMHTIHDDFLGLYGLHRMFAPASEGDDERFPFTRDNHLLFLDNFESIRYDYVFQFLTDNPLQYRQQLHEKRKGGSPICFRDAIVGNSKIGSWYSYGFLEPQGPIPNKTVSGLYVRDAATYLMNRMSLPIWDEQVIRSTIQEMYMQKLQRDREPRAKITPIPVVDKGVYITFFSRQIDRVVVNESEVIRELQDRYGLPVKTVRMEDMHLGQQAAILRSTAIAVGVHGSALILSIFLPPGAILIELFPYAVPAENYTPYKTLSELRGMRIAYRSWTNKKEENNYPHPERPPSGGGIVHLPLAEQEKVKNTLTVPPHLCCRDPYWLYRIYQDTRVDISELFAAIGDAMPDALRLLDIDAQNYVQIRPGVIDTIRCKVHIPEGVDSLRLDNSTKLDVEISWDEPWNGVQPDKYGVWMHQPYQEFFTTKPSIIPPACPYGGRYDVWVRSYVRMPGSNELIKSQYSEKFTCMCTPTTNTRRDLDL